MVKSFYLSLVLLCLAQFSLAQKATNITVESSAEELIIRYDLMGREATMYNVDLKLIDENGEVIIPKSLYGDIGEVLSGDNKQIVWDVYADVDQLSGSLTPEIDLRLVEEDSEEILPTPEPPRLVEDVYVEDMPGRKKLKNKTFLIGSKFAFGNTRLMADSETDLRFTNMFSWEAGIFTRWNAHRKIYIQPEVVYHRSAHRIFLDNVNHTETIHHTLRATGLIGYSPFGGFLYVHAGPYYERDLAQKHRIYDEGGLTQTIEEWPAMNNLNEPFIKNDFGYVLGGNMNFGKGSFAMGVQYAKSLNNILNEDYWIGEETFSPLDLKNRALHFYFQKSF